LSGQRVDLLEIEGQDIVREETLVRGIGRVRDVRVGPDGFVYIALDDRDGEESAIVRLEPVTRGEVELR
jgi:glucose/arabinose dehydrogenase